MVGETFGEDIRKSEKPRLLTCSNSIASPTGYGVVMKNLLTRLTDVYDVFSVGFEHLTAPLKYEGVMCLPSGNDTQRFGADIIPEYARLIKPKYFITCTDLHQLFYFETNAGDPLLEGWIKCIGVDASPIHPTFTDILCTGYLNVVPSQFGTDAVRKLDLPTKYIPFGVNTSVFTPEPSELFFGLKDKFIFGSIGKNTERKRWDRLIRAFSLITKECSDAVLICYTDSREVFDFAIDAYALAQELGIGSKVYFPSHVVIQRSLMTDSHMSCVYNAFDVHLNAAEREAFCLPVLESMSCGKPNIVVDYSAPPEIVQDTGLRVKPLDWTYHSQFNYRGALADVEAFAEAMRTLYDDKKLRTKLGKKSRKRALNYDWDKKIVPQWKKLLDGYYLQEL